MKRKFKQALMLLLLAGWLSEAVAFDPFVGLILHIVQNRLSSANSPARSAPGQFAAAIPGLQLQAAPEIQLRELKALVHESFPYLSAAQREETYASLERIISDPKNAAAKPYLIAQFAETAFAVREAYRKLSTLSEPEKRRVATEIRQAYESYTSEEQETLLKMAQSSQLPLPGDLNKMVLDELGRASTRRPE